jgi:hypothetical protein
MLSSLTNKRWDRSIQKYKVNWKKEVSLLWRYYQNWKIAIHSTYHQQTTSMNQSDRWIYKNGQTYSSLGQTILFLFFYFLEILLFLLSINFWLESCSRGSRDSVVGIATGYRLDDRGIRVRVLAGSRMFYYSRRPDRLWCPPSLLCSGYRRLFPRG